MIYTLYRSNFQLVLLGLPIVITLLWLGQLLSGADELAIQNTTTVFIMIKSIFPSLWVEQLFAMTLIVFSGVLLNATINKEEFFEKQTFLPAFTYVIVMSIFSEYHLLHPIIIANFFVILAIRRLFHIRRAADARRMIFDSGFFLGISVVFYEYYLGFYLLAWGTLSVLRPFVWREHALGLIGLIIPLMSLLFYHFITDSGPQFLLSIYPKNQYAITFFSESWYSSGVGVGVAFILLMVGGKAFFGRQKMRSLRFKRISNIILFMGLIVLMLSGVFILLGFKVPAVFMCAVLCSFLLTFYFFYTRKQRMAATVFYITLILCTLNIYYDQLVNIFL